MNAKPLRLLAVLAGLILSSACQAAVTFGASVTNANGTLSTTLTWNAPGASGCTASGHPAWTGAKPSSGTLALPAITMSGTYSLTLSCTTPGNASTVVNWTAPVANTDGTPLTDLAGSRVVYGRTAAQLDQVRQVSPALANSQSVGDLTAGVWFFAVIVTNAGGVDSVLSNVATKTVTSTAVENASVTLTVNPIPRAASGVTAN